MLCLAYSKSCLFAFAIHTNSHGAPRAARNKVKWSKKICRHTRRHKNDNIWKQKLAFIPTFFISLCLSFLLLGCFLSLFFLPSFHLYYLDIFLSISVLPSSLPPSLPFPFIFLSIPYIFSSLFGSVPSRWTLMAVCWLDGWSVCQDFLNGWEIALEPLSISFMLKFQNECLHPLGYAPRIWPLPASSIDVKLIYSTYTYTEREREREWERERPL